MAPSSLQVSVTVDVETILRDMTGETHTPKDSTRALETWFPRILGFLADRGIHATFFVVAQDLAKEPEWGRALVEAGHEVASHSFSHPKQLSRLSGPALRDEVRRSKETIETIIGRPVFGFRAPGYTLSTEIFEALDEAGYLYDSSLNVSPTYNLVKHAARLLLPAAQRREIAVERSSWRRRPLCYRPSRSDYLRPAASGEEFFGVVEIPVRLLPVIGWPVVTSVLQPFGAFGARWLLRTLYDPRPWSMVSIHDFEFARGLDYVNVFGRAPGISLFRYLGASAEQEGKKVVAEVIDAMAHAGPVEYRLMKDFAERHTA